MNQQLTKESSKEFAYVATLTYFTSMFDWNGHIYYCILKNSLGYLPVPYNPLKKLTVSVSNSGATYLFVLLSLGSRYWLHIMDCLLGEWFLYPEMYTT